MNSKVKSASRWQGQPLPRGRHELPRAVVRASQRERLLRAFAEVVGEEGYGATTVPKVVAAAHVSTNTFYEFFADKTDCFIAVCDQGGNELFAELARFRNEPDWLTTLERGLDRYLHWWQERSALTRAYLVELPAAGQRAIEEKERQNERFSVILRFLADRAREEQPDLPPLREIALATAVAAPAEIIGREVRAGRLEHILELKDDLRYLLIKLLADDNTATRVERDRCIRRPS